MTTTILQMEMQMTTTILQMEMQMKTKILRYVKNFRLKKELVNYISYSIFSVTNPAEE